MQYCSTSSDDDTSSSENAHSAAFNKATELSRLPKRCTGELSLPHAGVHDPRHLHLLDSQSEQREEPLVSHALARSDALFDMVCEHYYPLLHSFVLYLSGERHSAEDVVQETLIAASDHWGALRMAEEHALRSWLYKTARNKLCDHYRHEQRRPRHWSSYHQLLLLESQAPDAAPDDEQIWLTMGKLSSRERECITYVLHEGYSIEETADMLQIKPSSVRGYLTRGRQKFRRLYRTLQVTSRTNGRSSS